MEPATFPIVAGRDDEEGLSKFPQTLQNSAEDASSERPRAARAERSRWVADAPRPPGAWSEVAGFLEVIAGSGGANHCVTCQRPGTRLSTGESVADAIKGMFPALEWCKRYNFHSFKNDLMAGLTLASLCIPQSIGYATLARLQPEYGLYTSVVPPLIYAMMGTSKELAIGPVAVVSMLISSMVPKLVDPTSDPVTYRNLTLTVTFFTGMFQAALGFLRFGFLVDLMSHAAVVGFTAGAAVVIGLQQLKGLLGIAHFTNKTDVVSVVASLWSSLHHNSWNLYSFIIGTSFLIFILIARFLGTRSKRLYWLPAIAPLISVIAATLIVFLTRADEHGVKIIKHVNSGLNPISVRQLRFGGPFLGDLAKIGLVVAVIALTEATAVGRSFASIKGYRLDGNKEMVAMGVMNVLGSFTSCYTATGSFSRTAVNFSAGCETPVSNIVMAVTVLLMLKFFTRLLYYTPTSILASIILAALPGLIDVREALNIWKVDKLDFLTCFGAFLGVLFVSVEVGLLIAVLVSFVNILLVAIQPGIEILGLLPGTELFRSVDQYPVAMTISGVAIVRLKSSLLCFANANFIKERILQHVTVREDEGEVANDVKPTQLVILDMSNLMSIDTSGIAALSELHQNLQDLGVEMAMTNPKWQVAHKMKVGDDNMRRSGRREIVGGTLFFISIKDAIDATLKHHQLHQPC
ncbi:hypothetical protein MLD38_031287 [Melastoma candidum]|uniref:Uncharacterized protein n=1 Tax=Melastoma candidum TaxID=119954 RepID=A0ACB9MP93_9MYRT|nr:hypothetical protein MLD38_031287 [Melastoma candidum]